MAGQILTEPPPQVDCARLRKTLTRNEAYSALAAVFVTYDTIMRVSLGASGRSPIHFQGSIIEWGQLMLVAAATTADWSGLRPAPRAGGSLVDAVADSNGAQGYPVAHRPIDSGALAASGIIGTCGGGNSLLTQTS